MLFPSTCKRDTQSVEGILISPKDGKRVGFQVKGGRDHIQRDVYAGFDGVVYLFAVSGDYGGLQTKRMSSWTPPMFAVSYWII